MDTNDNVFWVCGPIYFVGHRCDTAGELARRATRIKALTGRGPRRTVPYFTDSDLARRFIERHTTDPRAPEPFTFGSLREEGQFLALLARMGETYVSPDFEPHHAIFQPIPRVLAAIASRLAERQ